MKRFCHLFPLSLCLIFSFPTQGAFLVHSLVKTAQGRVPISELSVAAKVACLSSSRAPDFQPITHKQQVRATSWLIIELAQDTILATLEQKFYVPEFAEFRPAVQLKVGDLLLSANGTYLPIQAVRVNTGTETELLDFYDITVAEQHNFFVSRAEVLVHNAIPFVVAASWSFGAEGIKLASISAGIAVLSWLGFSLSKHTERSDSARPGWDLKAEVDGLQVAQNMLAPSALPSHAPPVLAQPVAKSPEQPVSEAQAPGKPTEADGYIPPKRWDGKKVKNPNGPGYGWPDRKGKVWIPTGPKGHGGPHWDVQNPDGSYDNVMPGGHSRGKGSQK